MDFRKTNAQSNTQTKDPEVFEKQAGSIYAAVNIVAKRADQITADIKQELNKKLEDFNTQQDSLEEVFENREQIEVSRYYERLAKPTSIAIKEFEENKIYFKIPDKH